MGDFFNEWISRISANLEVGMSGEDSSPPSLPLLPDRPNSPQGDDAQQRPGGRVANKICRVCGDKALGYNFNVVTCESCKAFFRRNATADKSFRCPFTGACDVNVVSRRMCQKCRLRKCFEVGMKKEWILTEEAKRRKRPRKSSPEEPGPPDSPLAKVLQLNAASGLCEPKSEPSEPPPDSPDGVVAVPRQLLLRLMESHGRLSGKAACSCTCDCGFYPKGTPLGPPPVDALASAAAATLPALPPAPKMDLGAFSNMGWIPPDLAGVEPIADLSGLYQNMINATINSELTGSPSSLAVPASPMTPATPAAAFSARDQRRLDELITANVAMKEKPAETKRPKGNLTLTDVVNLTDIAVRRIIQMSKKIAGFRSLCQEDQIALLKGSCTEVMILQGLMTYDPETDMWKNGAHEISCDVLKDIKGGDAYIQHKKYLSSFNVEWRRNECIMLLLEMITLFNPSRQHITHPHFVEQQQESYYALLKRFFGNGL